MFAPIGFFTGSAGALVKAGVLAILDVSLEAPEMAGVLVML